MELLNTISNNRTWNRHGTKVAWVLAILCLLLIVMSIAWDARKQNQTKVKNYSQQKLTAINTRQAQSYNVSNIVKANLFGDSTPKPVVVEAKPTTLNLTLQGILAATDTSIARAIITSGKKKAGLYSVGEDIQGVGASIKEIHPNEVLLNRAGAVESLKIKKLNKKGSDPIISYSNSNNRVTSASSRASAANLRAKIQPQRQTAQPRSPDTETRKVRKPNFSGLDRALKKMGEI